jgi:hypothetical protein
MRMVGSRKRAALWSTRLLPILAASLVTIQAGTASADNMSTPLLVYHNGPVLSPSIFLLFWGNFPASGPEVTTADNYMKGLVQYMSNGSSPPGMEPTLRQYGVWGATYSGYYVDRITPLPSGTDNDTALQAEIATMQQQHPDKVPPYGPGTLILVVMQLNSCAGHHMHAGVGKYYGVVAYPPTTGLCYGTTSEQWFEGLGSHEIFEAVTNPAGGLSGWVTDAWQEEVDPCSDPDSITFPNGYTGWVSHQADNISRTCTAFTTAEYSPITAVSTGSGTLNVFGVGTDTALKWITGNGAGSWSPVTDLRGQTWENPSAVSIDGRTIDAFVKGTDNQIYDYHFDGSSTWTLWGIVNGLFTGPPSAVVHAGSRVVFAKSFNGWVWLVSDGGVGSWSYSALAMPSGVSAVAPPVAFARTGSITDVYFTGSDGHLYWAEWTGAGSFPPFTDLGLAGVGLVASITYASSSARQDLFFPGLSGAIYQDTIVDLGGGGFSNSGFFYEGGVVVGGAAGASFVNQNGTYIDYFVRGSGASGGGLYFNSLLGTGSWTGFLQTTPSLTVTGTPVVRGGATGSDLFARRHSDGRLVHQRFAPGNNAGGAIEDLGVSLR